MRPCDRRRHAASGTIFGTDEVVHETCRSSFLDSASAQKRVAAAIEDPPADQNDPATNIRIAVTLIQRIASRVDDPTPAKVASIWNFTGWELVNDFGARVQDAHERRLWALPVIPAPEQRVSP